MKKSKGRKARTEGSTSRVSGPLSVSSSQLLNDIRKLIVTARERTAQAVNVGLVALYWSIGDRIRREILGEKRAGYGEQIVSAVGRELSAEFGDGFSEKSLRHMIRFAEVFQDREIVSALRRQLSWTHFKTIIYLDDPLKRDFYADICRLENWSTRTLRKKIGSMLYERTALSRKPRQLIRRELNTLRREDKLTPDLVFRDPYMLDFLGLRDTFSEKDLEAAILRELEAFILELGVGFAFVARQKRIQVDDEDYYLDLLFFHRNLRRLVAVELKLGKFKAVDKGQMELYLRWLDKHERQPGEEAPVGLILCAGKSQEQIELLELARSGIRVAEYLTELPPRELLAKKLHEAIEVARERLARRIEAEAKGGNLTASPTRPEDGNLPIVRKDRGDNKP